MILMIIYIIRMLVWIWMLFAYVWCIYCTYGTKSGNYSRQFLYFIWALLYDCNACKIGMLKWSLHVCYFRNPAFKFLYRLSI